MVLSLRDVINQRYVSLTKFLAYILKRLLFHFAERWTATSDRRPIIGGLLQNSGTAIFSVLHALDLKVQHIFVE